jgi:acetyltransferase-like isoleucine patch superfamily enzyme
MQVHTRLPPRSDIDGADADMARPTPGARGEEYGEEASVAQGVKGVRRGRTLFLRFKRPLRLGAAVLRLIPRSACVVLLSVLRHIPTATGIALRYMLVARLAMQCGDNVAVFEGVYLFEIESLSIGNNVSIHEMCYVSAAGGISIGDDVSIAHASTIMSTEHVYSDSFLPIRESGIQAAKVRIGNDVWIGAGVKILAGVTIGDHAVVGAGAVVVRDLAARSVAVGVPARVIKTI